MRITLNEHKELVRSAVIEEEIRLSKDSLDDQVDSILLRFEKDCIVNDTEISFGEEPVPGEEAEFGEGLIDLSSLLTEAPPDEEEEEEDSAEPDPEDEELPDMSLGDKTPPPEDDESQETNEPEEKLTADKDDEEPDVESDPMQPKIDVGKFAGKVSRLVTNYENLLDVKTGIANRAYNYLDGNYSSDVAEEFAEILERDFEMPIERKTTEEPEELPIAVGAGASGIAGA